MGRGPRKHYAQKRNTDVPFQHPDHNKTCLMCAASFHSRSPFNRVCDMCKTTCEWKSGGGRDAYYDHVPIPAIRPKGTKAR